MSDTRTSRPTRQPDPPSNGRASKPPEDPEAERCVLGAMLIAPERIPQVLGLVDASDFWSKDHAAAFDAIVAVWEDERPVDVKVVADELGPMGSKLDSKALLEIQSATPSSANVDYYAGTVARVAVERRRWMRGAAIVKAWEAGEDLTPLAAAYLEDPLPAADRLRSQLVNADALEGLGRPQPLIGGLVFRNSLVVLYGRPGAGKSFISIDWALSCGSGTWWLGREVEAAPVLYVASEGLAGLPSRVGAWKKDRWVHQVPGVAFLPQTLNLMSDEAVSAMVRLVTDLRPSLIVIDTLARCIVGGDENSAQDMGKAIEAAERIRSAGGSTVLLVHHSPKGGDSPRGSSALEGAADTIIEAKGAEGYLQLICKKQKDSPAFNPVHLALKPVEDSCVVVDKSSHGPPETTDAEERLLETLRETAMGQGVSQSELRKVVVDEQQLVTRATYYRVIKALVTRKALINTGSEKRPFYVLNPAEES